MDSIAIKNAKVETIVFHATSYNKHCDVIYFVHHVHKYLNCGKEIVI